MTFCDRSFLFKRLILYLFCQFCNLVVCFFRLGLVSATYYLLHTERKFVWTVRVTGHSNTLIVTCAFVFLIELLSTVSWNDTHWWFVHQNSGDKVDFSFLYDNVKFRIICFIFDCLNCQSLNFKVVIYFMQSFCST